MIAPSGRVPWLWGAATDAPPLCGRSPPSRWPPSGWIVARTALLEPNTSREGTPKRDAPCRSSLSAAARKSPANGSRSRAGPNAPPAPCAAREPACNGSAAKSGTAGRRAAPFSIWWCIQGRSATCSLKIPLKLSSSIGRAAQSNPTNVWAPPGPGPQSGSLHHYHAAESQNVRQPAGTAAFPELRYSLIWEAPAATTPSPSTKAARPANSMSLLSRILVCRRCLQYGINPFVPVAAFPKT